MAAFVSRDCTFSSRDKTLSSELEFLLTEQLLSFTTLTCHGMNKKENAYVLIPVSPVYFDPFWGFW